LKPFVKIWVSNINFLLPMWLVRMVWLRGKTVPFVRWLRWCSTSIGLRGDIRLRRWKPHAMLGTGFCFGLSRTRRAMSSCIGEHLEWAISWLLVVSALFSRWVGLISLSWGLWWNFLGYSSHSRAFHVQVTMILTSRLPSTRPSHAVCWHSLQQRFDRQNHEFEWSIWQVSDTFLVLIKFHELFCEFHRQVHILGEIGTNVPHEQGTAEPPSTADPAGVSGPAPWLVPGPEHLLSLE
jgi:hypothetical protein